MKKKNFVTLVVGVIAGFIFSIGMCMCLIPEWNAFNLGAVMTAIGFILLLTLYVVRLKMDGKHFPKPKLKTVAIACYCIISVLALGTGMCLVMVWDMMLWGIIVGIIGIALLLGLIPIFRGIE